MQEQFKDFFFPELQKNRHESRDSAQPNGAEDCELDGPSEHALRRWDRAVSSGCLASVWGVAIRSKGVISSADHAPNGISAGTNTAPH